MAKTEIELRQDIVDVGRLMYQKGWVAANDGNISIRLGPDRFLCTPTGCSKGMMQPDELIIVDAAGKKLEGKSECTTEIAMHLTIYEMRPDVNSVVHAHPPVATGFAAAGRALNLALLPEVVVGLGCVPLARYGLPGTAALSEGMRPFIPKYDALLLENHGATSCGEDVWKAYFKMETIEHFARVTLVAELVGGPKVLPRRDVAALYESRARYGVSSRSNLEPGFPLTAEDLQPDRRDRIELTRDELIALVDEALRARGGL